MIFQVFILKLKEGSTLNKKCFLIILLSLAFLMSGCVRSANEGAEKYKNGRCVAFYPGGNDVIRDYAMSLCENKEERIYDYIREESGDLHIISYLDGKKFYVDENNEELKPEINDGADILSNHLRYEMKKAGMDIAYTSKYWLDTDKEELDLSKFDLKIADGRLDIYNEEYDFEYSLPLGFLKALTGMDPGIKEETDERLVYIDPDRPMIAITYDDGPYIKVDIPLYELFDRYGARATFYSVGSRMSKTELENIGYGISLGMEFGSHTENHENLGKLSANSAKWTVYEPIDYVSEKLRYSMKSYRPPYGVRNKDMEAIIDIPAILWTVDSKDWSNRDKDITYERIMKRVEDGDIVLMHSLYMSSYYASEKLVPELIDQGYQLVTVSELLEHLGYDMSDLKSYGFN